MTVAAGALAHPIYCKDYLGRCRNCAFCGHVRDWL